MSPSKISGTSWLATTDADGPCLPAATGETMKKAIGVTMIISPFLAMTGVMLMQGGPGLVATVWGTVAGISLLFWGGVYLLDN